MDWFANFVVSFSFFGFIKIYIFGKENHLKIYRVTPI